MYDRQGGRAAEVYSLSDGLQRNNVWRFEGLFFFLHLFGTFKQRWSFSSERHLNVSILATCLSGSDKLTNQLEVSVWRIISPVLHWNGWTTDPPFPFCFLSPSIHFPQLICHSCYFSHASEQNHPPHLTTPTPASPAFEGVNQTGELNAYLMSQRQLESGD